MANRINPNIRKYVNVAAGESLQNDTQGKYKYRHVDGQGGGHVVTITVRTVAGASDTGTVSIILYEPNTTGTETIVANLDTISVTAAPISYVSTFTLLGHYNIDVVNDLLATAINVSICS